MYEWQSRYGAGHSEEIFLRREQEDIAKYGPPRNALGIPANAGIQ